MPWPGFEPTAASHKSDNLTTTPPSNIETAASWHHLANTRRTVARVTYRHPRCWIIDRKSPQARRDIARNKKYKERGSVSDSGRLPVLTCAINLACRCAQTRPKRKYLGGNVLAPKIEALKRPGLPGLLLCIQFTRHVDNVDNNENAAEVIWHRPPRTRGKNQDLPACFLGSQDFPNMT